MSGSVHPNCELAFANSAYLSELWAVRDLIRIKHLHPLLWTSEKEQQLRDEVRHARLLRDFLHAHGAPIVADVAYAMQARLYLPYLDLSLSSTPEEGAIVHDLTEHRATWIYRTYMRHGTLTELVELCRRILEDEKQHFTVNAMSRGSRLLRSALQGIDRQIFRKNLPIRYGRIMLFSTAFWDDYYKGATAVDVDSIDRQESQVFAVATVR